MQRYPVTVSWQKLQVNGLVCAPTPGGRSPSFEARRGARMLVKDGPIKKIGEKVHFDQETMFDATVSWLN